MSHDSAVGEEGYRPPPNFEEDTKEALIDLDVTDSTELWLIQLHNNLVPDFDRKEVTLKLHHNGKLGGLEGSSGKEYELVSNAGQEPDATVFLPSLSSSKIVGKISRRVSLVHYLETEEFEKLVPQRSMYQRSSRTSLADGTHEFPTPTQISIPTRTLLGRANTASTHGSRRSVCFGTRSCKSTQNNKILRFSKKNLHSQISSKSPTPNPLHLYASLSIQTHPKSDISNPTEISKERQRELANSPNSDARNTAKSSGHARGRSTTTISGSLGHSGGHNSSGVSSGPADSSHHKSSKKRKGGE